MIAFAVVFGIFAVVMVVLIVLIIRWAVRRGRADRAAWTAGDVADEDEPEEEPEPEVVRPVTAMVLAGGGTRGAAQVGMLQVLAEYGVVPDMVFGASVGAVNGAAFAGKPTVAGVEHLTEIWRALDGDDVYPQGWVHGPWQYLRQRPSIHPNSGLRRIIEDGIEFEYLEDALLPFEVVATSLVDGRERWFSTGPAVDAIMASAAIPAIFPAVEIDGDTLIDGGVVNNVPISRAIDAGATRILVLLCGPATYVPLLPRRPVEAMLSALYISVHARFPREMARLPEGVEVVVLSADAPVTKEYTDFSDTELLIQAGRAEASEVIRLYGLHEFVRDPPTPRPFVDRGLGGGAGPDGGPEGDRDADGEAGAPRPVPEAAGPDADAQSSGDPGGVAGANRTTSS
jgi:NTE family protein